jgi:hypothetical protein
MPQPCPAGHFCDEGSIAGTLCSYGKISAENSTECSACPAGGVECSNGYMTQRKGWWRSDSAADAVQAAVDGTLEVGVTLYACYNGVCRGSEGAGLETTVPDSDKQCEEGFYGPVCALCTDGYTRQSDRCVVCPHMDAQRVTGVMLLVLVVVMLCVLAYRLRKSQWLQPAVLKVVLGFYQLVAVMQSSFNVIFPPAYGGALHGIKLALGSVADLPSMACAFEVNWFQRLYTWTFGMLAFALGLWYWDRRESTHGSRTQQWHALLKRLFYLGFACFPLAAPVIVAVFDCRSVGGVQFIEADYTLRCEGGAYLLAATWAAVWGVGFVLGFPTVVTLALRRRYKAVAFLAKDYKGGAVQRMWEVVDLVKKLLVTSAIIFIPRGSVSRIAFALFVSVMFQVLQAYFQPYSSLYKNRIADAANAALSMTYFMALLIRVRSVAQNDTFLGVLLILLLVLVLLAGVVALVSMKRQIATVLGNGEKSGNNLAESLLDNDDEAQLRLTNERLRTSQLEGELHQAREQARREIHKKEQALREKEQALHEKEQVTAQVRQLQAHAHLTAEQQGGGSSKCEPGTQ